MNAKFWSLIVAISLVLSWVLVVFDLRFYLLFCMFMVLTIFAIKQRSSKQEMEEKARCLEVLTQQLRHATAEIIQNRTAKKDELKSIMTQCEQGMARVNELLEQLPSNAFRTEFTMTHAEIFRKLQGIGELRQVCNDPNLRAQLEIYIQNVRNLLGLEDLNYQGPVH